MDAYFDVRFASGLGIAVACTTVFSLTTRWQVRQYRNVTIMACYGLALVSLFVIGWRAVVGTWTVFGLAGGLIYFIWDVYQRLRIQAVAEKPRIYASTVPLGLLAWPILVPEAVEYALTDLGVLPSAPRQGRCRRVRRVVHKRDHAQRLDTDATQQ